MTLRRRCCQMHDFETIYGERIGKRQLASNLIIARDKDNNNSNKIAGLVGIEMALLKTHDDRNNDNDEEQKKILKYAESEQLLKNAISSLGPKQRRQYKDAALPTLVSELPDLKAADGSCMYEVVIVLANLAVRGDVRGVGLGVQLCREAERIVMDEWWNNASFLNCNDNDDNTTSPPTPLRMMLQVEDDNAAAKGLYEKKLGYVLEWSDDNARALRADVDAAGAGAGAGEFVEVPCVLLTLGKTLEEYD